MNVDGDAWADYLCALIGGRDDGADLACGTGAITLRLIARGKKVFGVDISPAMLAVATGKAAASGVRALFVQGDMAAFRSAHPLGFVTCACDGINYPPHPERAFAAAYDALSDGGVYVFDVSSEYKLREVIGDNTFSLEDESLVCVWRNRAGRHAVDMELTFFEKTGALYARCDETQRQYIHSEETLVSALKSVGFTVKTYGFGTFRRPKRGRNASSSWRRKTGKLWEFCNSRRTKPPISNRRKRPTGRAILCRRWRCCAGPRSWIRTIST